LLQIFLHFAFILAILPIETFAGKDPTTTRSPYVKSEARKLVPASDATAAKTVESARDRKEIVLLSSPINSHTNSEETAAAVSSSLNTPSTSRKAGTKNRRKL